MSSAFSPFIDIGLIISDNMEAPIIVDMILFIVSQSRDVALYTCGGVTSNSNTDFIPARRAVNNKETTAPVFILSKVIESIDASIAIANVETNVISELTK